MVPTFLDLNCTPPEEEEEDLNVHEEEEVDQNMTGSPARKLLQVFITSFSSNETKILQVYVTKFL